MKQAKHGSESVCVEREADLGHRKVFPASSCDVDVGIFIPAHILLTPLLLLEAVPQSWIIRWVDDGGVMTV